MQANDADNVIAVDIRHVSTKIGLMLERLKIYPTTLLLRRSYDLLLPNEEVTTCRL